MIKLGKVYGNLMVDVKPSNEKLIRRCVSIVCAAAERRSRRYRCVGAVRLSSQDRYRHAAVWLHRRGSRKRLDGKKTAMVARVVG